MRVARQVDRFVVLFFSRRSKKESAILPTYLPLEVYFVAFSPLNNPNAASPDRTRGVELVDFRFSCTQDSPSNRLLKVWFDHTFFLPDARVISCTEYQTHASDPSCDNVPPEHQMGTQPLLQSESRPDDGQ